MTTQIEPLDTSLLDELARREIERAIWWGADENRLKLLDALNPTGHDSVDGDDYEK